MDLNKYNMFLLIKKYPELSYSEIEALHWLKDFLESSNSPEQLTKVRNLQRLLQQDCPYIQEIINGIRVPSR